MEIAWEGETIKVAVHISVAVAKGGLSETDLFEQADDALYAAKRAGRNRVVFYGAAILQPKDEADAVAAVVTHQSGKAGLPHQSATRLTAF